MVDDKSTPYGDPQEGAPTKKGVLLTVHDELVGDSHRKGRKHAVSGHGVEVPITDLDTVPTRWPTRRRGLKRHFCAAELAYSTVSTLARGNALKYPPPCPWPLTSAPHCRFFSALTCSTTTTSTTTLPNFLSRPLFTPMDLEGTANYGGGQFPHKYSREDTNRVPSIGQL